MKLRHSARFAAVLLAAAGGCFACSKSPDFAVRGPLGAAPAPSTDPPLLRALHFGDFGDPTRQQKAMATAMIAAHGRSPFDLAFSVGDNIYDCGADVTLPGADKCAFAPDGNAVVTGYTPPVDERFHKKFELALQPLVEPPRPLSVYLLLGNHDIYSTGTCRPNSPLSSQEIARLRACLEVAHQSPAWRMPGRHYFVDQGPVRFIVIDSNLLIGDYGGFTLDSEVTFVQNAATACTDRVCFIVAHHPPVTAGSHISDGTPEYLARVARIEAAAGGRIAGWLAGHDHDLQHLRTGAGLDVFVSGNSSRGRSRERFETLSGRGTQLLFGSTIWGYGVLEVRAGGWSYRFENDKGAPIHCCTAMSGQPCQPVACAAR